MIQLKVNEESGGSRVDVFIANNVPVLNRSHAKKLAEAGKVQIASQAVKPKHPVRNGDVISIDFDSESINVHHEISLPILYEDDDCIVINKPAGVLTHSKGFYNPEGTVATFIQDKVSSDLDGDRAGIVHRLDRATSGVILCAKNAAALKFFQRQFSSHKVTKVYVAIVSGHIKPEHAIIDMPIRRNPKNPKTFQAHASGKSAITEYKVLQVKDNSDVIEARPQTGRTHQLRVHFAKLGHPIVGDTFYDGKPADRLYLHALSLKIQLPSKEFKDFTAPLPQEFDNYESK